MIIKVITMILGYKIIKIKELSEDLEESGVKTVEQLSYDEWIVILLLILFHKNNLLSKADPRSF